LGVRPIGDLLSIAGGGEDGALVGAQLRLSENQLGTYS
jgi:hypothetical protein